VPEPAKNGKKQVLRELRMTILKKHRQKSTGRGFARLLEIDEVISGA